MGTTFRDANASSIVPSGLKRSEPQRPERRAVNGRLRLDVTHQSVARHRTAHEAQQRKCAPHKGRALPRAAGERRSQDDEKCQRVSLHMRRAPMAAPRPPGPVHVSLSCRALCDVLCGRGGRTLYDVRRVRAALNARGPPLPPSRYSMRRALSAQSCHCAGRRCALSC